MCQKERKKSDISQVIYFSMHWDDSQLCVKQLWWESAPQSLRPWFSTEKTEQCCYGDERAETKDEGSLDPCSVPYPWSSYLGKIYEDKVVNTSDHSEFPS